MHIVQVPSYHPYHGPAVLSSPSVSMPVRGLVSPVRRRLFTNDAEGDAQESENRKTVERQLAEIQLEKSKYWNFDFFNEVPLNRADGRYQWQQSTTLPDRPSHPLPPPAGIKRTIDNQVDGAPLRKQMKSDLHNNNNINNRVNQTKITDFLKNQKLNEPINKHRDNNGLPSSSSTGIDH